MAFSASRKIGARRRIRAALGVRGLGGFIPEAPSFQSIVRQLITGVFVRGVTTKRIVKPQYTLEEVAKGKLSKAMKKAAIQASFLTTAQAALHVLGELIFSSPIRRSNLAQAWRLSRNPKAGYRSLVSPLNHEQVFVKAQSRFKRDELPRILTAARRGNLKYNLRSSNNTPYLTDARSPTYWHGIRNRAWSRQKAKLQRTLARNQKQLMG